MLDKLHGTDSLFKKMVQSKRHKVVGLWNMPGLTPVRERFPDEPKNRQKTNGASNGVNGYHKND